VLSLVGCLFQFSQYSEDKGTGFRWLIGLEPGQKGQKLRPEAESGVAGVFHQEG